MKIAVIGYSGSGKSTMARQLGSIYEIPVLHLDKVHFLTSWQERDDEEAKEMTAAFMENKAWVIDGNYSRFHSERRFLEADKIIFFNFNRLTCLFWAYNRYRTYKGKTREDMADGCNEKLDYEFIKWLLIDGRTKKRKNKYKNLINKYPEKVTILKNRKQAKEFLNNIINNKVILGRV